MQADGSKTTLFGKGGRGAVLRKRKALARIFTMVGLRLRCEGERRLQIVEDCRHFSPAYG